MNLLAFVGGMLLALVLGARAEEIGSVDTSFQWLGPNHKIVVEVFDDPKVEGVSCYLSRTKTGGISGALGVAEEKSDASVACRQIGESITLKAPLPRLEDVFTQKTSLIFKTLRVTRMVDPKRRVLVYLVHSDKLIDGSPKNSITAVPVPAGVQLTIASK